MLDKLKEFLNELKTLRKDIKNESVKQISKKALTNQAEKLGSRWFSEFSSQLSQDAGIAQDILTKYSEGFGRLIVLSAPNNLKKSYLEVVNSIIKPFRDELILVVQKGNTTSPSLAILHTVLGDLPNEEEDVYLKEAISCAQRGFLRAAVVLGWCATIDRIHHRLENVGFSKFNVTSAQMASQQKGRFKRFNTIQNINSLSELREVFDTIILWVLEGMGMIDSNQHTRLKSCFDMRCHCAHPGEAPITEYNLMSFFSDINEIILQNPDFNV